MSAREAQRAEVVEHLVAGRRAVVVGPPDGEGARALPGTTVVGLDAFLRDGADGAEAVVSLDPVPGRALRRLATALGGAGVDAVLAVDAGQEALVAPVLGPGAQVLRQVAVEVLWLGPEPPERLEVPGVEAASATRVLFVLGAPTALPDPRAARAAVAAAHHDALEAELVELRGANARLRATQRPVESAAAGAMAGRAQALGLRVAALEEEQAELHHRLAEEVEVGLRNDRLFQQAREVIDLREQEIRGLRGTLARPQHRVAASAGARASRVPVLRGLLRRSLRRLR